MTSTTIIVLCFGYGLSFLIIYSKNFRWVKNQDFWLGVIPFPVILYFILNGESVEGFSIEYGCLTSPLVIGTLNRLFNAWSQRKYGRNYYLHIKGSKDLNGLGLRRHNKHFKISDYIFSSIVVMLWVGWPMIFVVLVNLWIK
ncbi:MAG: hypothetical protein ACJAXB_000732 [Candidatus Endobugula sp.]|jgi:hypothetical protein